MNRNYKNHGHKKGTSPHPTKPHKSLGGVGRDQKKNRPTHSSYQGMLKFWKGGQAQANDNMQQRVKKRSRFTYVTAFVLMLGSAFSLNSSTLITQAVLHADDAVLSAAMDISPEALGYTLNKVRVGE